MRPVTDLGARAPASLAGARARRQRLLGDLNKWTFIAPACLLLAAILIYPTYFNIRQSLEHYTITSFFTGRAPFVGLANYRQVLHDPLFNHALFDTAMFTVGSLVAQFGIGLGLAVFFARDFPLNTYLRALLLIPWLLPLSVSASVWRWIYDADYGVLNQTLERLHLIAHPIPWLLDPHWALFAVILTNIWVGVPFNMVILYGGLRAIPDEYYEAARVDGANAWRRFRDITLPLLRPVILIVLTLGFITTIKVFDVIMVLTKAGPADGTQTLATWSYFQSFQTLNFGRGAATANLLMAISLAVALIYVRSVLKARRLAGR